MQDSEEEDVPLIAEPVAVPLNTEPVAPEVVAVLPGPVAGMQEASAAVLELESLALRQGKLSAASAEKFGEIYSKIRSEAPEIIHEIRVKGGLKGPLHYPHMHVVRGKSMTSKDKTLERLKASFSASGSIFSLGDHATLALVSILLIVASFFLNCWKKGEKNPMPVADIGHLQSTSQNTESISTWDGTVTTFSAVFGVGFLCLPYAMSLAGWVGAPIIIFLTACAGYTGQVMTSALQQEASRVSSQQGKPVVLGWGFLMRSAYGPRAERAVNIFLVIELWGYMLSGIVSAATNLNQLLPNLPSSAAIGLTVLVQFGLAALPMRTLSRLNVIGNILFVVCCLMFLVTGLMLPSKALSSEHQFVRPEGVAAACGIIIFSPASHSLYPAIMQKMKHPEQYSVCLRRAYVLACVVYVCFAVSGYYLFGSAVQPSAVRNIGVDRRLIALPNLGWMNYVASFSMLVKVSSLQPLIMAPLISTIEGMFEGWVRQPMLSTLSGPCVLTISAVVAIHFAQNVAALLTLVGSVFCMSIAFVLPALCYWRINADSIGPLQQVVFSGLILMGGSFAILGLISALDS
jgi:vesicular inhibitory amino acid transporter